MDCKTARMLLEFARPRANELDETSAAELEQHLAGCPECDEQARTERRIDQHLGQAMRQVEVPDRLHKVLLARLAQEGGSGSRKRRRWIVSLSASAAAMLLVGLGVYLWYAVLFPTVDLREAQVYVSALHDSPLREETQEYFRELGYHVTIPEDLNFSLLSSRGTRKLQNKQVPELVFRSADGTEKARVYFFTSAQFTLREADLRLAVDDEDSRLMKPEVRYAEGERQACIIFYTGDSVRWLLTHSSKSVF